MKKISILLFALSSMSIHSMEESTIADAVAKRKLECEFLKAARDGGRTLLEAGLAAGTYINAVDVYGRNALHLCLSNTAGQYYLPDILPRMAGINMAQQDSISGNTPLHTYLEITLTAVCSQPIVHSLEYYTPLTAKLIPLIPAHVLTTPNYLGKFPYDYLDEQSKIGNTFPLLQKALKPQQIPQFKAAAPWLLSAPFTGFADIKECLQSYIDRKIVRSVLNEFKIVYLQHRHNMNHKFLPADTRKAAGIKVLRFLTVWDYLSQHLKSHGIFQPEITYRIAWHHQFEPELSAHEKGALTALLYSITVIPNTK